MRPTIIPAQGRVSINNEATAVKFEEHTSGTNVSEENVCYKYIIVIATGYSYIFTPPQGMSPYHFSHLTLRAGIRSVALYIHWELGNTTLSVFFRRRGTEEMRFSAPKNRSPKSLSTTREQSSTTM